MTFECVYKIFKNTKIFNKDLRELMEVNDFDFAISDGYDAEHNVHRLTKFNKYEITTISTIDTIKKRIYLGTRNQEVIEPIDIKVKDFFILLKHARLNYLYSNQKMIKSIKKIKIEFLMYIDGKWVEEKFYCYPYKEYLESNETIQRFLVVAEAYIEEISEILITEDNEVIMRVIVISEEL